MLAATAGLGGFHDCTGGCCLGGSHFYPGGQIQVLEGHPGRRPGLSGFAWISPSGSAPKVDGSARLLLAAPLLNLWLRFLLRWVLFLPFKV